MLLMGSGPVSGYLNLKFNDGSELWTKYTGTVKVDGNHVPRKGTFTVIGGKGRFAGWDLGGDGAQVTGTDAVNYIDSVINIKTDSPIGIPHVAPQKIQ
jgi:hypothetical protein